MAKNNRASDKAPVDCIMLSPPCLAPCERWLELDTPSHVSDALDGSACACTPYREQSGRSE